MVILGKDWRPKGIWFTMHRSLQIAGVLLTLCGFGFVYAHVGSLGLSGKHHVLGLCTIILAIFQVFLGVFRPHKADASEKSSLCRTLWEIFHKLLGYGLLVLATFTAYYGLVVLDIKKFESLQISVLRYLIYGLEGAMVIAIFGGLLKRACCADTHARSMSTNDVSGHLERKLLAP